MIKSSPFSFVRFEHPTDKDYSLDIPYTLPAFENHEVAFQFGVTIDRPAGQDIEVGIGDSSGALIAVFGPVIVATPVAFRYELTNLLTYATFWFNQISIDGDVTIIGQTVTYEAFQQILFDLGLCQVKVISNNPLKLRALEEAGLKIVERVSIEVDSTEDAAGYLRTKKEKLGHLLDLKR